MEKLTFPQLVKNVLVIEHDVSSLHSQEPAIFPYPEPDQPIPIPIQRLDDPF
jgi:hypothetical protein